MKKRNFFAGAALWALFAGSAQAAGPFSTEIIFGDSLSDDGNVANLLHLPASRYTTNPGLTAFEYLGQHYGIALTDSLDGGTDFAYGGAGVDNNAFGLGSAVPLISEQVQDYLTANPHLSATGLYAIWGGGNDANFHLDSVASFLETEAQAEAAMTAAGTHEAELAESLHTAGAGLVVVFNLPDVGASPSSMSGGAAFVANGLSQSLAFDRALNAGLAGAKQIVQVNTIKLTAEIGASPAAYGFTHPTGVACTVGALLCTPMTLVEPGADLTYGYADGVHPTTQGNLIFADAAISEVTAPGQMSLLTEAPLVVTDAQREMIANVMDGAKPGDGVHVFGDLGYAHGHFSGDLSSPDGGADEGVITAGVTDGVGDNAIAGLAVTGARGHVDLGSAGGFDTNETLVSAFGRYHFGGGFLGARLTIGSPNFTDIRRTFALGTVAQRTENSDTAGFMLGGGIDAGWRTDLSAVQLTPFAGFSFQRINVDAIEEANHDSLSMTFEAQHRNQEVGDVGARADLPLHDGSITVTPNVEVAYDHDFAGGARQVTAAVSDLNGSFEMAGYDAPKNWVTVGLGVRADLSAGWQAVIDYNGNFGDNKQTNALGLQLNHKF